MSSLNVLQNDNSLSESFGMILRNLLRTMTASSHSLCQGFSQSQRWYQGEKSQQIKSRRNRVHHITKTKSKCLYHCYGTRQGEAVHHIKNFKSKSLNHFYGTHLGETQLIISKGSKVKILNHCYGICLGEKQLII